jgi:hypothetical protein
MGWGVGFDRDAGGAGLTPRAAGSSEPSSSSAFTSGLARRGKKKRRENDIRR